MPKKGYSTFRQHKANYPRLISCCPKIPGFPYISHLLNICLFPFFVLGLGSSAHEAGGGSGRRNRLSFFPPKTNQTSPTPLTSSLSIFLSFKWTCRQSILELLPKNEWLDSKNLHFFKCQFFLSFLLSRCLQFQGGI